MIYRCSIVPVSYTHLDVYKRQSYSRVDDARVQKTEGAGLGMAITKYIVDAMQGTIDIQSELQKGCLLYTSRCV